MSSRYEQSWKTCETLWNEIGFLHDILIYVFESLFVVKNDDMFTVPEIMTSPCFVHQFGKKI
jgi:hypothetical protein